jgi:hypothetical protein
MKESLARVSRPVPEEIPHIQHPEAANDSEVSQPITTIYHDASPERNVVKETLSKIYQGGDAPEAANDNLEITTAEAEKIEEMRAKLALHAEQWTQKEEAPAIPTPEVLVRNSEIERSVEELAESAPVASASGGSEKPPQQARGAGGSKKEKGGTGNDMGKRGSSLLSKAFSKLWGLAKGIFWVAATVVAGVVLEYTTAIRTTVDKALKAGGIKDGGGGGGASKPKPAAKSGGGDHH